MNEIQIIQRQLQTERQHFAEVAATCASALDSGTLVGAFATACADYFAFAVTRFAALAPSGSSPPPPKADSSAARWREFLQAFTAVSDNHFESLDALKARNPLVTEWRAVSRIDADSIFTERACYERFKATAP